MNIKIKDIVGYSIAVAIVAVPVVYATLHFSSSEYITNNLILAATGILIFFYTYETYKLRRIAEQNTVAERRPVLFIDNFMNDSSVMGGLGGLRIRNSGKGTALDIGITVSGVSLMSEYNPGDIPEKEDKVVGVVKDVFNDAIADKDSVVITISYADLAGVQYRTDVTIAASSDSLPGQGDIKDVHIYKAE